LAPQSAKRQSHGREHGWVLSTLHQRSFGVVILFLGVLAMVVGARDYAHSLAVHFRAIHH